MSNPSGYPTWTGFLYDAQENSDVLKEKIDDFLSKGKYEEAAEELYNDMNAPAFNEFLHNSFGNDKPINVAIQYLPYLFDTEVITTNYDAVLKRTYEMAGKPFEEQINGGDANDFSASLGSGKRTLLKLHGDYSKERNRILTLSEYNRHYVDTGIIKTLIEGTFFNKTILFLGASLNKDRLITAMAEYVEEKGHDNCVKHYCFLEDPGKTERTKTRNRLSKCNIFPIWYPANEHNSSIEALLIKLKGEFE